MFTGLTLKIAWEFIKGCLAGVVAFLRTPVGQIVAVLCLLVLSHVWGIHRGTVNTEAKWEDKWATHLQADKDAKKTEKDQYEKAVADQKKQYEAIGARLIAELDAERHKQGPVRTIIKEVTKYVSPKSDAECTVPAGFVFVHNSAVAPGLAISPPRDADAPSGVALSTVAETVGSNYLECDTRKDLLDRWMIWYNENKKVWENFGKKVKPPPK